jgi:hypothetical protein
MATNRLGSMRVYDLGHLVDAAVAGLSGAPVSTMRPVIVFDARVDDPDSVSLLSAAK